METTMQKVGKWAWIVGICLAVVLGVFADAGKSTVIESILVILGLIVGIINVTLEETKNFLLAAAVLLLTSFVGGSAFTLSLWGGSLSAIMTALVFFVAPMTIVVAVKAIYAVAKDQ